MAGDALLAMIAEDHRRQEYPRAGLDVGNVLARLDHFARYVAAENVWQRHATQAPTRPQIQMIQRAGANADQNVIFAQNGIGRVFVLKNFRTTEFMNPNRFHLCISIQPAITFRLGRPAASYQGTTSVVPQELAKNDGFSR